MAETPGTGPVWHGEPLVSRTPEPDWADLANRHEHEVRRRKQIRVAAAGAAGVLAIAGIMATVIQLSGAGPRTAAAGASAASGAASGSSAATAAGSDGSMSVPVTVGGGSPSAAAPGGSSAPGASGAPAAQSTTPPGQGGAAPAPGGAASAPGGGGKSTAPAGPGQPQPSSAPAPGGNPPPPQKPPAPTPTANNPYTPVEACGGGGYFVIDSHALSGATVYLLYNNGNGNNCVVTMATHPSGSVPMNATLAVQGGGSGSNPGNFTDYAGPVVEHAPGACVTWGGSYQGSSWTSGWSHCAH